MATIGCILLVEGKEDKGIVEELLRHHNISSIKSDNIIEAGGKDNLLSIERLRSLLKLRSGAEQVGIIIDADDKPAERWNKLRETLQGLGYDKVPTELDPNGMQFTQDEQVELPTTVGIWLFPDNIQVGALESFLISLIPQIERANLEKARKFKGTFKNENDRNRKNLEDYFAIKFKERLIKTNETPLIVNSRVAFNEGYLDPKSPNADSLMKWIQKLAEFKEE